MVVEITQEYPDPDDPDTLHPDPDALFPDPVYVNPASEDPVLAPDEAGSGSGPCAEVEVEVVGSCDAPDAQPSQEVQELREALSQLQLEREALHQQLRDTQAALSASTRTLETLRQVMAGPGST